jgi:hypothetical protein
MFGHQDQADNNVSANNMDQGQPVTDNVDSHIQDFNQSGNQAISMPPSDDNSYQAPLFNEPALPPGPSAPINSDQAIITLPNPPSDQIVNLVDLKSKALDELYPIIHKLDLSAEDNFKTLMMMIQATDNKELIGQAYEAAEKIDDEGARAKALLDIVNEINYFTNHPNIDQ